MKFCSVNKFLYIVAAIAATIVLLFSCKNDIAEVKALTFKEGKPDESSTKVHIFSSANGIVKQEFIFEKLDHFSKPEPYYEVTNGFEIISYDETGEKLSSLTAQYGINYEESKKMEAKNNVIITNFSTGEIIETEHLIWDTEKKRIYSNTQIKQTKPDGSVYIGDKFESDENMEQYTVFNPKIIIYANQEE